MAKAATPRKTRTPKLSTTFWKYFQENTLQVLGAVLTFISSIFVIGFYVGSFYGKIICMEGKLPQSDNALVKKDTIYVAAPQVTPTVQLDSSIINKLNNLK